MTEKETKVQETTTNIVGKTTKESLKYKRDKDREKVKGVFRYYEVPGGTLEFPIRLYKGDPVVKYELRDGEVYELPLGVARHLNNNCWYPEHEYAMDKDGKPVCRIGKKRRRTGFQSLEFIDPEDFSSVDPGLVTVEHL